MIKTCYYDKKSFLILSIINIIIFISFFISLLLNVLYYSLLLFVVILVLMIITLMTQIIIFFASHGTVVFTSEGIELKGRINKKFNWNIVKGIYYCNNLLIGELNCVEIWIEKIDSAFELLDDKNIKIHCTKKKYIEISKIVPLSLKEANKYLFYENIYLREKDEFKLYK